jgi:hypothetical protein
LIEFWNKEEKSVKGNSIEYRKEIILEKKILESGNARSNKRGKTNYV